MKENPTSITKQCLTKQIRWVVTSQESNKRRVIFGPEERRV